jgi:hypothetical protein
MTSDLLNTLFFLRILGGLALLALLLAMSWLSEAWYTRSKRGAGAAAQESRALLPKA